MLDKEKYKCTVLGLGYIGLPTAAIIANEGHNVIGVDININIVNSLNKGKIHIKENDLEKLLKKILLKKNFKAALECEPSDVFIIAVPTPFYPKKEDNLPQPNLDFVFEAAKSVAKVIKEDDIVILESTSPVGTTKKIAKIISDISKLKVNQFKIAYCPERVIPGNIIYELVNNDRVIGGINDSSKEAVKKFYSTFVKGNLSTTDVSTAELIKLVENSYRDVNLAFCNEVSIICDKLGINPQELIALANKHPRVNILQPSCGVGGHCIAVDPWFLASSFPMDTKIIQLSREINNYKNDWVIKKIHENIDFLKKSLGVEIKLGIFGLSFKPNVDDLRESPALKIATHFKNANINLKVCEPNINYYDDFELFSKENLIENCNLLIFLVAHNEFKKINLLNKNFLDFCGITNELNLN